MITAIHMQWDYQSPDERLAPEEERERVGGNSINRAIGWKDIERLTEDYKISIFC